jgi:hypothetical protein
MAEKISPAWRKQYRREQKYDDHFKYAEGANKKYNFTKYGKSGDSLKGGISNPKNWPGGKWEMTHDPHADRSKIEKKEAESKKRVAGTAKAAGPAKKTASKKQTTRKRVAGK